jgi:hypothetical protein
VWTDRTDPKLADGLTEAYIVFNEKNGLSSNTKYQVVLNARFNDLITNDDVPIQVWIMDDYIERPFEIIEHGKAQASELADR